MKKTITVTQPYIKSFRTEKVAGMFDIPAQKKLSKQWQVDLPIEKEAWNIGLIVGASGSGKTTLAKQLFEQAAYHTGFKWPDDKSLVDGFDAKLSINEITNALSHVGFSSPPNWLLPFDKLSNGQKFRCELARIICENKALTVVDEFTSVVDREVAKVSCAAVAKAIRKKQRQIVAVSCHYDIIEWLQPDWVLDVNTMEFSRRRLRRPDLNFKIYRCPRQLWRVFKDHHYLSADISPAAQCFIGCINAKPVAFSSYIHFMHAKLKNCKREHRTVVLPDYQGFGFGNILSDFVAGYCKAQGFKYISTSSHPAFIFKRAKSKNWLMTRKPSILGRSKNTLPIHSTGRMTASFRYIGPKAIA